MNAVERAVSAGGRLVPLTIPPHLSGGTGLLNPSVAVIDGKVLVNLRHVNYALYHDEGDRTFPSLFGPLAYLHPETDVALRTRNWLLELDDDLSPCWFAEVQMLDLHEPCWEFTGLEDCRLVEWDGRVFLIGVRRDTKPNGEGRMELSELYVGADSAREVARTRIPAPDPNDSYCEKNWMPVVGGQGLMVKWTAPTEVVQVYPGHQMCDQVSLVGGVYGPRDLRGGSQVFRWRGFWVAIVHECELWHNDDGQKDARYRHRVAVWDDRFALIGLSPEPWSFLDGEIEFCAGATVFGDAVLLTFGFQDNAAFLLQMPSDVFDVMVREALTHVAG